VIVKLNPVPAIFHNRNGGAQPQPFDIGWDILQYNFAGIGSDVMNTQTGLFHYRVLFTAHFCSPSVIELPIITPDGSCLSVLSAIRPLFTTIVKLDFMSHEIRLA
jgi:hypothetical protein